MAKPPNILMIVGEDTGRLLGCYGDPAARTPNLDRLAGQGCRYDRAFAPYPVCAPSRSAMVSGQYPMKIGTHPMRSVKPNPPRLFTHELRDAGYFVDWHSKLDFNFEPTEGWRDTDADWLPSLQRGEVPDQPWFYFTNIGITHESSMWFGDGHTDGRPGRGQIPTEADRPPEVTDPAEVPVPAYLPDTPIVRRDIAHHYDNITELDRRVGEILDALDASGQADHTLVMFLADHGRGLPREKRWPYPAGIHMPLLMRWPSVIEPGTVENKLVSWVDLAPTLLSLAGAAIPEDYDGRVFLGPDAEPPRDYIFAGRDRMDEAFDMVRTARSDRWHYCRNFYPEIPYLNVSFYQQYLDTTQELYRLIDKGELTGDAAAMAIHPKPAEELYDTQADPDCVHNLAEDPACAEVLAQHRAALETWMDRINDLGRVSERDLIERGLTWMDFNKLYERAVDIPAERGIGIRKAVVEP